VRVLFNQGLSNVQDAVALIRQAMRPGEFHLTVSYNTRWTSLRAVADAFLLEPRTADGDVYLNWLLDGCRQHRIDLLWPQSRLPLMFAQRRRFAEIGVKILLPCLDLDTLAILDDKRRAAERLGPLGIALPRWRPFRDAEELALALEELGYPQRRVCVKPVRGMYAQGFRILDDSRSRFDRLLGNDPWRISVAELRDSLADNRPGLTFLAMEYLQGDERSIDCLVNCGRLVRSVTRRKPRRAGGRFEIIEDDPVGQCIAAQICAAFQLNGLINIQTCERLLPDGGRQQCFLEVNARMSGGINMACLSGLALPYWALRLACGDIAPDQIPRARAGLLVATAHRAFILAEDIDRQPLDVEGFGPPAAKP
jgi:carbamoylphosphate synthase large subunit